MTQSQSTAYGAFVLRIALGTMFLAHAFLKIIVFTPSGTVGFFQSLDLPAVLAYATIAAELFGGLALIVGVATRWVSLALLPVLAGALLMVHGGNGWLFSNNGGGWEYPAFLMAASVAQAFLGDGAFAMRGLSKPAGARTALA